MKQLILFLFILLMCSFSFKKKELRKLTQGHVVVELTTSYGDMKMVLYNATPLHRDNFVQLVEEGYYDSLIFHRVINDFMIQGGDAAVCGRKVKEDEVIPAELNYPNYHHRKGALAAARMPDDINPEKKSSKYQFYIVDGKRMKERDLVQLERREGTIDEGLKKWYMENDGTPRLDKNYTVFGEVIEGLEVIDSIAAVKTGRMDRPKEDVYMHIRIVKKPRKFREGIWDELPRRAFP